MSLAVPIDRYPNRIFVQPETVFGAASDQPVRELTGKSRFSYAPVHGQGGGTVGIHRLRTKAESAITHWQASSDGDYHHGALAAELFKLLFELQSESTTGPLTTYQFRLRRQAGLRSAKLGLEYEPSGPFYILHGVVLDSVRLSATARGLSKLRLDFKAKEIEQVPLSRDYTHPDLTFINQNNFRTETVAGPCYEDGVSGLSCMAITDDVLLSTEDGFVITTEDGFAILLDSEATSTEPQSGNSFNVTINGEAFHATEASMEFREMKTPARFGVDRLPRSFRPGAPTAGGEIALYMNGDEVPALVRADSYAAVEIAADFGDGRGLTFTAPRVKFGSGTPDVVGRGELVYRAPFSALEPSTNEEETTLELVV